MASTATAAKPCNKAPYDGYVIGLNLPLYVGPKGDLVKFPKARIFETEAEAQSEADRHEARSRLEYFVDPIRNGKVVPISERGQ